MNYMSFNYEPTVEVLQALVKKPLYEQNMLAKALCIWVILRTIYSEDPNSLNLSLTASFSYADWYNAFFRQSKFHSGNDVRLQSEIHDPKCPCAYSIEDWLFNNPDFEINRDRWCKDFKSLRTGKTMDDEELKMLFHPDQTATFEGIKPKKDLIKEKYPQIKPETINFLFKKANQRVSADKSVTESDISKFCQDFPQIDRQSINDIFQTYINTRQMMDTHRPMWGTRRSFNYMFNDIVNDLGFLAKSKSQYYKLESLPELLDKETNVTPQLSTEIIGNSIPNLIDWEEFFQPINEQQRFFVDLENIIPNRLSERIEEYKNQLKSIWSLDPIPPVKLIYRSARKHQDESSYVIYPVCFYYIKRAPYLFAYGTTPRDKSEVNWYDYRVDRILNLEELDWESSEIPPKLIQSYQEDRLPVPEDVQEGVQAAFGYDFFKPHKPLILRFNQYFHANYIEGTERDNLFKTIPLQSVKNKIARAQEKDVNSNINKKLLLSRLETSEYQNSIYCQVNYYLDDNNVVMRLRSWSPNVEVISPWRLRQRMKEDIKNTWKLYESD